MQNEQPTKVITGKVRLSYANLFHPKKAPGSDKAKFSTAILIPKADKVTVNAITKGIEAAKEAGKEKWGGKIPAGLKLPLRDGDTEKPEDENYAGMYFINCTSDNKPGIIDRRNNEITDEDDVYSGCYARVSINFYPFNTNGNKGVAAGLNNVMKWEDGEALAGRASAEADFAEILESAEEDNVNDLL